MGGLLAGVSPAHAQSAQLAQSVMPPHAGQLSLRLQLRIIALPYKGKATAAQRQVLSAVNRTVPLWKHKVTIGSSTFSFEMVGRNPFRAQSNQVSTIKTIIVPIRFTFKDSQGSVIGTSDPTRRDACSPEGGPVRLVLQSPIFQDISFNQGVELGQGELVSAGQLFFANRRDGHQSGLSGES